MEKIEAPARGQGPGGELSDRTRAGLFALATLVWTLLYAHRADPPPLADMERYIYIARSILALSYDGAVNFHYPPLFPALIALLGLPTGDFETAAWMVSMLAGAAAAVPIYFLARGAFGRRGAALAAGFYAFRFAPMLATVQSEPLYLLLVCWALWFFSRALEDRRWRGQFGWGLLLGAAFLVKPEAWAYFLLFVAITGVSGFLRASPLKARLGEVAAAVGLAGLGYFIMAGPYLAAYRVETGQFDLNPKAKTLFHIHNYLYWDDSLYRIQWDVTGWFTQAQRIYIDGDKVPLNGSIPELLWEHRVGYLRDYPGRFGRSFVDNVAPGFLRPLAPWVWPVLLSVGMWPERSGARRRRLLALHGFALAPLLMVPLFSVVFPRFYFSLSPWMVVVLGGGADRALGFIAESRRGRRAPWLKRALGPLALLLLAASGGWTISSARPDPRYRPLVEFRRGMAAEVKAMLPAGCAFMAELGNPSPWYLADLPPTRQQVIPSESLDDVIKYALTVRSKLIVFYQSEFQERYQNLFPLLDPTFSSPYLKLRDRRIDPGGNVHVIYELTPLKCEVPSGGGTPVSVPSKRPK